MKSKKSLLSKLEILAAVLLCGTGLIMFLQNKELTDLFMAMSYKSSIGFYILGAVLILGAVGMFFSITRFYTTVLLLLVAVTAIGTQIGTGHIDIQHLALPTILFLIVGYIVILDNSIAAQEEEDEIEQTGTLTHMH